jgi:FixJ family two-component response regulator
VSEPSVVIIVDDDELLRSAITDLLQSQGYVVRTFESAEAFMRAEPVDAPACLLLDVHLPDQTGLDLQMLLKKQHRELPIVFMTGAGDVPMSVRAMKAGASEFLLKPLQHDALLAAVKEALAQARAARVREAEAQVLRGRYAQLSKREREVFQLVIRGLLNKQIAHELGISEPTVKIHRGQVMHKMAASSLAELVRMSEQLDLAADAKP